MPIDLKTKYVVGEEKAEKDPMVEFRVPASLGERVLDLLDQETNKQGQRMIKSLGAEMAKRGSQEYLDAFTIAQAIKLQHQVLALVLDGKATNSELGEANIKKHPEFEADTRALVHEGDEIIVQLQRVGTVAYIGRYFKSH
jgi:hypothetical protein